MIRRKTLITYLIVYSFAIGTMLRYQSRANNYPGSWTSSVGSALVGLFAAFFVLLALEPWLSRRSLRYTHLYLIVQTGIVALVSLLTPGIDYFSTFFLALIVQAMLIFPPGIGFRWLGMMTIIMAVLMLYGHPFSEGLPLVIIMSVANLFVGSYAAVTREAETAREEAESARKGSQRLLAELQDAHQQLQAHTATAEELAVAAERNRLARDLHDSVTQSLYSLTLFTQAARELADVGKLEQAQRNLARIADTAAQALKEMRLLVYQLRPLALKDDGLVVALQHRLDMVERRSGVQTRLLVEPDGDVDLPAPIEEELYHIAQEALNNALKHAHATAVTVHIVTFPSTSHHGELAEPSGQVPNDGRLELDISDDGCGFDSHAIKNKSGLGLTSMRERAAVLGAELNVSSVPGQGTYVKVSLSLDFESLTEQR